MANLPDLMKIYLIFNFYCLLSLLKKPNTMNWLNRAIRYLSKNLKTKKINFISHRKIQQPQQNPPPQ